MKIKSKKLSYGSHYIDQSDLAEVEKSLLSERLSIGSYVSKFENLMPRAFVWIIAAY